MDIHETIAHICRSSYARVDRNFGQGKTVVCEQLERRLGRPDPHADALIKESRKGLAELRALFAPNELPADYVVFLEYYGGMIVKSDFHTLMLDGIGPMVEEWYGYIVVINLERQNTALYIGGCRSLQHRLHRRSSQSRTRGG